MTWTLGLAVLGVLALLFGGRLSDSFETPNSESQKASRLLEERFPSRAGDTARIIFEADDGIRDPRARRRIGEVLSEAESLPEVAGVTSPFARPGMISEDGRIAYATIYYDKKAEELDAKSVDDLTDLADKANGGRLRVEVGGRWT